VTLPRTSPQRVALAPSLAALLLDRAPDALIVEGSIIFENATCAEILGYTADELVGMSVEKLIPEESCERHRHSRDVRAHRAFLHELETAASTDSLTGALNRSFENAYGREAERCHRQHPQLFLMMIDIDHFKAVDDRYGHATGDEALRSLATICTATLRKTDVRARIGGEEFAALAAANNAAEAVQLAERIREKVSAIRIGADTDAFGFTLSIGLAEASVPDEPASTALQRADTTLYEAKRTGRNRGVEYRGALPPLTPSAA